MIDVVFAQSEADARAAGAVEQHHAEMSGVLAALDEGLVAAASRSDPAAAEEVRTRVVEWCENDLLPHAVAEEQAPYPPPALRSRAVCSCRGCSASTTSSAGWCAPSPRPPATRCERRRRPPPCEPCSSPTSARRTNSSSRCCCALAASRSPSCSAACTTCSAVSRTRRGPVVSRLRERPPLFVRRDRRRGLPRARRALHPARHPPRNDLRRPADRAPRRRPGTGRPARPTTHYPCSPRSRTGGTAHSRSTTSSAAPSPGGSRWCAPKTCTPEPSVLRR